ncbi:UNVERIFIED_CONTAM: O-fucosyltransferase 9 [Sesamum indicum]
MASLDIHFFDFAELMNVWNPKLRQGWKPCIKQTVIQSGLSEFPKSNGFLIIEANGGLNQQRLSDMVAFSCCVFDGGEEEKREMDIVRERSWRGKFRRRGRVIRPGANRVDGKCPLTPLEVGMMLRGMGFDNTTSLYVAAGKIYKVEKHMAPLKQMFPGLETKDSLASPEELAPFMGHSSRLAALDYTVCLHSEVFVTTQGGNFPHFLVGHRRYFYEGHAKTIRPDKRKLAQLFDKPSIRWQDFKRQLQDMLRHNDVKGSELRKPSNSLYMYPMPDCMCRKSDARIEYSNTTKTT